MTFLDILRNTDSVIDYKHVIFKEPDWNDSHILSTFLYQYEFAGYGYNTYMSQSRKGLASASPLQYFVMTSENIIFFSHDLKLFYIDNANDTITYINNFFKNALVTSLPFSYFMTSKDSFSLFTSLPPLNQETASIYGYDLSTNLCLAAYLDSDILSRSVSDNFEHKEFFVHAVAGFFHMYQEIPHSCLWSIDSLMRFCEKDDEFCDYHNVTFDYLKITPENKYKLLCKLKEYASIEQIRHFILTDKLHFPSYFHTNTFSNCPVLGFNFRIYDIESGQRFIATSISQDPVIYKHFNNLSEYIIHSPYVYSSSPNYALTQIDNALAYYRKKHNFQ